MSLGVDDADERLVGPALRAAGLEPVDLDALRPCGGHRSGGRRGQPPIQLTLGALAVLRAAQRAEERGFSRGDALADVNAVASRYLDLVPDSAFAAVASSAGPSVRGRVPGSDQGAPRARRTPVRPILAP